MAESVAKSGKGGIIKLKMNLFDESDPIYYDALCVEEEYGFEDICLHGQSDLVQLSVDGTIKNFSAKEFAIYLRNNGYNGGDIRLASCSTGKGDNRFAQQLSKELGVRVKAPDDDLYYAPEEGTYFVGTPKWNKGSWRVFNKGVEE